MVSRDICMGRPTHVWAASTHMGQLAHTRIYGQNTYMGQPIHIYIWAKYLYGTEQLCYSRLRLRLNLRSIYSYAKYLLTTFKISLKLHAKHLHPTFAL